MTIEIIVLLCALLLLFALVMSQGMYTAFTYGLVRGVGARDDIPFPQPGMGGRIHRTIVNYKESLFFFIPLILLTAILGVSNSYTVLGAQVYLAARIIFVPLYILGVPWLRSVVFFVAVLGVVSIAYGLFI